MTGGVRRLDTRLSPVPRSAADARTFVTRALRSWALPEQLITDIVLAASELVTNAVEHGRGEVAVELWFDGACLRLRVGDEGGARPVLRPRDPTSPRGRGLAIIDAIASAWGHQAAGGGKWVWAEFPLPDQATGFVHLPNSRHTSSS